MVDIHALISIDRPLPLSPSAGIHFEALRTGRSGAMPIIRSANRRLLSAAICPALVVGLSYTHYFCVCHLFSSRDPYYLT